MRHTSHQLSPAMSTNLGTNYTSATSTHLNQQHTPYTAGQEHTTHRACVREEEEEIRNLEREMGLGGSETLLELVVPSEFDGIHGSVLVMLIVTFHHADCHIASLATLSCYIMLIVTLHGLVLCTAPFVHCCHCVLLPTASAPASTCTAGCAVARECTPRRRHAPLEAPECFRPSDTPFFLDFLPRALRRRQPG